jgi:hypothetical protein
MVLGPFAETKGPFTSHTFFSPPYTSEYDLFIFVPLYSKAKKVQAVRFSPTSGCSPHFSVTVIACRLYQIAFVWLLQYIKEGNMAFSFATSGTHEQGSRCYGTQGGRECLLDEQSLRV